MFAVHRMRSRGDSGSAAEGGGGGFAAIFKEALIKSLSAFILGFLCNARNGTTRIASYLRMLMTQYWTEMLMKSDSANESVLPSKIRGPAGT